MTRSSGGLPTIIRGRIYGAVLGKHGEKYYLAVSNNQRNQRLDTFLAVRLTTTPNKPPVGSIVRLTAADDPWTGCVLADDIVEIYRDEVTRDLGALRPTTMRQVDDALRAALALR